MLPPFREISSCVFAAKCSTVLTTLCPNRVSLFFGYQAGWAQWWPVTLLEIICLISRVLILRSNKVLRPRLGLTIQKWKKPRRILVNIHRGLFTPPEYFSDSQRIRERRTYRECRHSLRFKAQLCSMPVRRGCFPRSLSPAHHRSSSLSHLWSSLLRGVGGDLKGRGPSASLPVSPKPCSAWTFLPPPTLCAFCSPF